MFDDQQIGRQQLAKAAVDFADALDADRPALEAAVIDPFLDRDMRFGLALEDALFGIGAVVLFQCSLYFDRVGVMSLEQVAVVAIHRANQTGERRDDAFRQAAAQTGGAAREREDEIGERRAVARALRENKRLHQADALALVPQLGSGRHVGRFLWWGLFRPKE